MWAVLRMFYDAQLDTSKYTTGPEQLAALRAILDSHLTGVDYEADQAYLDRLRQTARLRGRADGPLLRDLGLWNALAEIVSPGALTRIRDGGTFYHFLQHNPSAVEWGIFWLSQASDHGDEIETIAGGVGGLVDALEARIAATCGDQCSIVCNAQVVAIENAKRPGEVELTVKQGESSYQLRAGHVILAVPQASFGRYRSVLPARDSRRPRFGHAAAAAQVLPGHGQAVVEAAHPRPVPRLARPDP